VFNELKQSAERHATNGFKRILFLRHNVVVRCSLGFSVLARPGLFLFLRVEAQQASPGFRYHQCPVDVIAMLGLRGVLPVFPIRSRGFSHSDRPGRSGSAPIPANCSGPWPAAQRSVPIQARHTSAKDSCSAPPRRK